MRRVGRPVGHRLLVLCWHNIDPTPAFPAAPGEGRRGFDRQLGLLSRYASVLSLRHALDLMDAGRPLPPRAVVLTFDDGYRDNLDLAVPALARHRLPATFFLVSAFLSGSHQIWWEELAAAFRDARAGVLEWEGQRYGTGTPEARRAAHDAVLRGLKRLGHDVRLSQVDLLRDRLDAPVPDTGTPFLDWDDARALRDAGHDVGSHTVRHPILSRESVDEQRLELEDSRRVLENGLGVAVDTLAYPNGTTDDYSSATLGLAADAGYRCALSTRTGLAPGSRERYEMRRVVIGPTTDLRSAARQAWWTVKDHVRARASALAHPRS